MGDGAFRFCGANATKDSAYETVMATMVIEIRLPEYNIDAKPDYMGIGAKVDRHLESAFEDGLYVVRAIGSSDHPGKSPDEVVEIILETGTDKYDSTRSEVGDFSAYNHDFQGSSFEIVNGKLVEDNHRTINSEFGDIVFHFYEHTPFDRGYPIRIDILIIYRAAALEPAAYIHADAPQVRLDLEQYLYRFRDSTRKTQALAGVVKILAE